MAALGGGENGDDGGGGGGGGGDGGGGDVGGGASIVYPRSYRSNSEAKTVPADTAITNNNTDKAAAFLITASFNHRSNNPGFEDIMGLFRRQLKVGAK